MSAAASAMLLSMLTKRLRSWLTPRFGAPSPEELAVNELSLLSKRMGDAAELPLPTFVVDSKTLCAWMSRSAKSRFHKWLGSRAALSLGGASRVISRDGQPSPAGLEGVEDGPDMPTPGDVIALEELSLEQFDALQVGIADCRRWSRCDQENVRGGRGWDYVFEQVLLHDRSRADVAAEVGINVDHLGRWLDFGFFCIARRFEYTTEKLNKMFGETWVKKHAPRLEAALRASR
jgi:hypothetical protein